MKNIIYSILIVIFSFSFTSCKKNDYHKVTFEVIFLQTPASGSSNMIDVYATPSYEDSKPYINRLNLPQVWTYDCLSLQKGDKVHFLIKGQLSYYFEMRVKIDGNEVSYRKVKVSDTNYYEDHVEASSGLNDKEYEDTGLIEFTYR